MGLEFYLLLDFKCLPSYLKIWLNDEKPCSNFSRRSSYPGVGPNTYIQDPTNVHCTRYVSTSFTYVPTHLHSIPSLHRFCVHYTLYVPLYLKGDFKSFSLKRLHVNSIVREYSGGVIVNMQNIGLHASKSEMGRIIKIN